MALTSDQIRSIEQVAAKLEKWAKNLSYSPPSPTVIRLLPDVGQDKVILCLLAEMPAVAQKVESDFKVLYEMHDDVYSWRAKAVTENEWPEFTAQVDTLKGAAYELVSTLRQIVQKAREELISQKPTETEPDTTPAKSRGIWTCVKRIPRWIYALIIFLAALLTIFHYLGWLEPIREFIYNLLWPE